MAALGRCRPTAASHERLLSGALAEDYWIVVAEGGNPTEHPPLDRCASPLGRLSVDVDVDPAVDLVGIPSYDGPDESLQLPITQLHSSSFATAWTWAYELSDERGS